MKILLVEPFFTGSHRKWAEGYQKHSVHQIEVLSLPGRHWKWRMYGGAVTLANQFLASSFEPDLILVSDMLDLSTFAAMCRAKIKQIPLVLYFHENQITYPWSPNDEDVALRRNNQYGFINYTSALVADKVLFNSHYHKESFINALAPFLKQFPDHRNLENIESIKAKSEVLYLGMDLKSIDEYDNTIQPKEAVLLWNHRWEYDKAPEVFFELLFKLQKEGIPFKLIVLGESYASAPAIFAKAKKQLVNEIMHWGYADSFASYIQLLRQADILPVTGVQDFFGGSVVEAIYANCYPILPNRLAYPEHIPVGLHDKHLYNSVEEAYELLVQAIAKIDVLRQGDIKDFISQYDWDTIVEAYDKLLHSQLIV